MIHLGYKAHSECNITYNDKIYAFQENIIQHSHHIIMDQKLQLALTGFKSRSKNDELIT